MRRCMAPWLSSKRRQLEAMTIVTKIRALKNGEGRGKRTQEISLRPFSKPGRKFTHPWQPTRLNGCICSSIVHHHCPSSFNTISIIHCITTRLQVCKTIAAAHKEGALLVHITSIRPAQCITPPGSAWLIGMRTDLCLCLGHLHVGKMETSKIKMPLLS